MLLVAIPMRPWLVVDAEEVALFLCRSIPSTPLFKWRRTPTPFIDEAALFEITHDLNIRLVLIVVHNLPNQIVVHPFGLVT